MILSRTQAPRRGPGNQTLLKCLLVVAAWGVVSLLAMAYLVAAGVAALATTGLAVLLIRRGRGRDEDAEELDRREASRVQAWKDMPLTAYCRGEMIATSLLNVSLHGMAVHWHEAPVGVGARVKIYVDGYLVLPMVVMGTEADSLRLRFTADVPEQDRRRLRNDCVVGAWNAAGATDDAAQAPAAS
jgi:hypothetical protein